MIGPMTWLRMCLVVLFGAMSTMHGPVMTFAGAHVAMHDEQRHAGSATAAEPDCHEDQTPPAKHSECNAFACFMAVEPLPVMTRPPLPVVFAVMAGAPMTAFDPLRIAPALPPPRLQG
jgi:hypothetical protein